MKITIITGLLNYPLKTGGDVVTFNLIRDLSQNNQLTVFYPAYENVEANYRELQNKLPGVELIIYNRGQEGKQSILSRIVNKLKSLAGNSNGGDSKEGLTTEQQARRVFFRNYGNIIEKVKEKAARNEVDVIQVEYPWMMGIVEQLPGDIPKVYNAIELTFSMMKEKAETITDEEKKQGWLDKLKLVKQYEIDLAKKYDALLTISEHDTEVWKKELPQHSITYSPMGIDTDYYKPQGEIPAFDKVIFIGHGKHHANLDAVIWFFDKMYPLLLKELPELKIYFTGEYSTTFTDPLPKSENIIWTGFVDDLRDYMRGAISISPVRIGSGIRIKIIESMSFGCPVVTTSIGREGIPCQHEQDIMIADDPEDFARAVIRLVKDQELAKRLSSNSRRQIMEHFDSKSVANKRERALKQVLEKRQEQIRQVRL